MNTVYCNDRYENKHMMHVYYYELSLNNFLIVFFLTTSVQKSHSVVFDTRTRCALIVALMMSTIQIAFIHDYPPMFYIVSL